MELVGRAEKYLPAMKSGVTALAVTPPGELETFRTLKRLQPRFETVLWLEPYRIAGEILLSSGDGKANKYH